MPFSSSVSPAAPQQSPAVWTFVRETAGRLFDPPSIALAGLGPRFLVGAALRAVKLLVNRGPGQIAAPDMFSRVPVPRWQTGAVAGTVLATASAARWFGRPSTQATRAAIRSDLVATTDSDRPADWLRSFIHCSPLVGQTAYRLAHGATGNQEKFLTGLLLAFARVWSGVDIHEGATIGPGLKIFHGQGVVVGRQTVIGSDCRIYQGVTVGENHGFEPTIGDRVTLHPGCVVVGAVSIGDDARIAANAVVVHDVPAGHTARGVPARSYSASA